MVGNALGLLPIGIRRTKSNASTESDPAWTRPLSRFLAFTRAERPQIGLACPNSAQARLSGRRIAPASSERFDVILPRQLPYPACHLQLKKRRKHFGRRKLRVQLIQDLVELEAGIGAQDLEHHRLLWS
jgi:hypothetical protein